MFQIVLTWGKYAWKCFEIHQSCEIQRRKSVINLDNYILPSASSVGFSEQTYWRKPASPIEGQVSRELDPTFQRPTLPWSAHTVGSACTFIHFCTGFCHWDPMSVPEPVQTGTPHCRPLQQVACSLSSTAPDPRGFSRPAPACTPCIYVLVWRWVGYLCIYL